MNRYNKISNIYKRESERPCNLIEGDYLKESYSYLKDLEWVATEKIDGTNIGVVWNGYEISYQGRTEKSQMQKNVVAVLDTMFSNDTIEIIEEIFGESEVVFFGEAFGGNIQKPGRLYREEVSFILFDIYYVSSGNYLPRESVEEIGARLDLEVVPIMMTGTLEEIVNFVKSGPTSLVAKEHLKIEGVVATPIVPLRERDGKRIIVKIKCRDF